MKCKKVQRNDGREPSRHLAGFAGHDDLENSGSCQRWRKKVAKGDVVIVRYADDFVVGFQHRTDAERFLKEFRERLAKFGLELNSDKTRLTASGVEAQP